LNSKIHEDVLASSTNKCSKINDWTYPLS